MAKNVPQEGTSLSFLLLFVEDIRLWLNDKSTREVCEEIIKPFTANVRSSYIDTLKAKGSTSQVGHAGLFVSHVWNCRFKDLVEACQRFADERSIPYEKSFLWIDIFSVNLHPKAFDWTVCSSHLRAVMGAILDAVAVLGFAKQLTWMTRAWCL
jgi:hypothetical protein